MWQSPDVGRLLKKQQDRGGFVACICAGLLLISSFINLSTAVLHTAQCPPHWPHPASDMQSEKNTKNMIYGVIHLLSYPLVFQLDFGGMYHRS